MKIIIKNCNNIDQGEINIEDNKLNIKFGPNGTGKSTITKAIEYKIKEDKDLNKLLPFKLQESNPEEKVPEVEIIGEKIKNVSIFNEEYVNDILFKDDELVKNSFDVFINTDTYKENAKEIENQLENIKKIFLENDELDSTISDLKELSGYFKFSEKTGEINKSSKGAKTLNEGNKIENIPDNIKEYKSFIQGDTCVEWLGWQKKGEKFSDGHDNCPYCVSATDEAKKEKIKSVSKEYDTAIIKNLQGLISIIEKLGDYFFEDSGNILKIITTQKNGLNPEQENFLQEIQKQIDILVVKLEKLKNLSFFDFKSADEIEEILAPLKIDLSEYFSHLNSPTTNTITENLNSSLDEALKSIGILKGNINKQKEALKNLIEQNQISINQFLKNAGYKYKVFIDDKNNYKVKLKHLDFDNEISRGNQHLSFGEKNAFALVLFMYQALSEKSELIILDDPISSFDKNKKYAILQMLFIEDESFKNKTVLMMTHDIEPVIDSIKVRSINNKLVQPNANFISTKNEILTEKEIKRDDILTFSQICEKIISDGSISTIPKLIYLRRNFEILNNKGDEYQILSDLLHRRTKDEAKKNRGMDGSKFETSFNNGEEKVKEFILEFDYEKLLKIVVDKEQLKKIYNDVENSYEKLQIFRIINEDFPNPDDFSDVMKKFINETYHIENDLIHQLNPREYDLVPEYIIKECDNYILSLGSVGSGDL